MIRVLMCGNHPSNKGGMTSVINQIREKQWDKDNVKITFVPTYMPGSKLKTLGFFIMACIKVFLIFVFRKPDVLYTHMSVRGSFSRTCALSGLCRLFHVKSVVHLHGSEFKDWFRSVDAKKRRKIRALIESCDSFIALGAKWERFVKKIAPGANVRLLHNAVSIPETVSKWNDKYEIYLFLGVLIPRKGVIDLLNAIKLLRDRDRIGNARFIIAGTGDEEKTLIEFVKNNELEKYVRFPGWIQGNRKETELKRANVFVLPSYNEGLPVSVLEAMSYGIPVISTDVGDISDAVKENVNGYLIKPGDVEALADRMERLMDKNKWESMSSKAREYAVERFDISSFYNGLLDIWKECVDSSTTTK